MADNVTTTIDSVEALQARIKEMRAAQAEFAKFTQEQVDKIFYEAAMAANKARIPLAKMAVAETGYGIMEDKVIKNHYASEYIYNKYKDMKTCDVISDDPGHLQVPHLPEDPQRHPHLAAPARQGVHGRGRPHRA